MLYLAIAITENRQRELQVLKKLTESGEIERISPDVFSRMRERLELTQSEDYLWYSTRHADFYVDVHICGRQSLLDKERKGVSIEELEECIDHYYKPHELQKTNEDAHWWGLYFTPIVEGEDKSKVWIRFPNEEKPIWFFVEGYDSKKGLILSPNPRRRNTMNKFKEYGNEFRDVTTAYPKTIQYGRFECEDYFKREEIKKLRQSNVDKRIGFLVYPPPDTSKGRNRIYGGGPQSRDSF